MNNPPTARAPFATRYKPDIRKALLQTLLAPLKIPGMILSPLQVEWAACRQSPSTKARFSRRLLRELLKAGWHEGRKLSHEAIAKMYEEPVESFSAPALQILEEFGGLRIGKHGAFLMSRHGDYDAVETVSQLLRTPLCPFGVTVYYCDTGGLWVDEQGRIFVTNSTNDMSKTSLKMLEYVAANFVEALEFLAAGSKAPVWPTTDASKDGVWYFKDE